MMIGCDDGMSTCDVACDVVSTCGDDVGVDGVDVVVDDDVCC